MDPKKLQLQLTGFLEKSTSTFMEELWGLLVDAQNSLGGIPSAFLQDKKQEMLQAKACHLFIGRKRYTGVVFLIGKIDNFRFAENRPCSW